MIAIIILIIVSLIAGAANVIAGAGSLLTFPVLVAIGLPPVVANVTNDIGITTGNISGVWGVRKGFRGHGKAFVKLLIPAAIASALGACLLLLLPSHIFEWIAPFMLLLASVLTLGKKWVMSHNKALKKIPGAYGGSVFVISTYGGYFGAGIGLLYMALLTIFDDNDMPKLNAFKNGLQLVSNGIAGVIFAFTGHVNWMYALIMAVGSLIGAAIGAKISMKISPDALRITISIIGVIAAIVMFVENFV